MDPSTISEQIHRILDSQSFSSKAQLRKLLEVLHTNIESQNNLNPDLIIRELWPDEVRTKRAADVATEVNRLRHALDTYYKGEGKSDPITIVLPNRAASAVNGAQEKLWIVAKPREEQHEPTRFLQSTREGQPVGAAQAGGRRRLKMAVAVAALCAMAVVGYIALKVLVLLPDQPKVGKLDGSALVIMNADGKELWRKVFPEGFGPDWYYAPWQPTHIWFGDLEGKGHTSVLFSYAPVGPLAHSSTLICYSDRGKERWRWTPGRELPELAGSPATFVTHAVRVLKATDKKPPRIVVLSQHYPWWPTQMAILDSNGKTISEYWHSGGLSGLVLADLDGDGREEIIAAGISEYDHQATLVVLDPDQVFGASTEAQPEFQIHGMGAAQERLRLLFPRSDLNRALYQFNVATELTVERGLLRLTVFECTVPFPGGCRIYYEFDNNFRLIAAYAGSDEFRSAHERFYQSGKAAHTLSAEEQAAFQKVRCLVGCKTELVPVGKLIP